MRVAVISDIHGNSHALAAVLAAIDREGVDAIWCLGDIVGYGPNPAACCSAVRERADVCLVGNHDLAVVGAIDLDEFAGDAAVAAAWTRQVLDERDREFLAGLTPKATSHGVELFHGSPRDPIWEYVLSTEAAYWAFLATSSALILVGHSHVALALTLRDDELTGGLAPAGTDIDLASGRWLLNPGSVGQPRDGDPRAAWLLLDLERRHATFQRVEYPIERTQAEMRKLGLPQPLVDRLASGV
jgi:predicted phosphodiesterase